MEIDPKYLSGFVDGEGSFLVSFSLRKRMKLGIETRPSFSVTQHKRDREMIQSIRDFFDCGGVRFNKYDQTYKYEVRSLDDLVQKIIPHFEKYPPMTSKIKDFEALRNICRLMKSNQHLSVVGMKKIIDIAYQMNNLGARRYSRKDLLRVMGR